MNELVKNQNQLMEILGAESLQVQKFDSIITNDQLTFPLADMFSLGSVFSGIATAMSGSKELYQAKFSPGKMLAKAKDGSGFLGGLQDKKTKKIAGQARFQKVDDIAAKASGASQIFMALAIMAINKSLEEVAKNQKKIIAFLETDKETKLKGDLLILSEIIGEFQHNWDNPQFKNNRENQVLDIKRSAEQNILFYREMAENALSQRMFVRFDVDRALNYIQNKIRYYRLSLYLYSFSSFLDVMLLGNYNAEYLKSVTDRIKEYSEEYENFHEKSIEGVGNIAETSIQSRFLQGLSITTDFFGKQIAKIPDKIEPTKLDDVLIESAKRLDQKQKEAVKRTRDDFAGSGKNEAMLFVDKIDLVSKLYNEPITICFDSKNIYLQTT